MVSERFVFAVEEWTRSFARRQNDKELRVFSCTFELTERVETMGR